jgi:hypothetical protein
MKNVLSLNLLFLLVSSFFLTSCDKLKDALKVDVAMQTADVSFTIPPQQAGTQTLSEFITSLNVDSAIKANNSQFGISNVKSVKITSVRITLLNGDGQNTFGALSDCKMDFSSNNKPDKVTLGSLSNNPDAAVSALDLPVNSSLELKDYFSAASFNYTLSGTTRRAITKTLECKATVKFNVQVGL